MDDLPGRVGVVEVEVGQLHPAVLDDVVPPAVAAGLPVPRPLLVRVLPVAQVLGLLQGQVDGRGQRSACRLRARRTRWRWPRRRPRCGRRRPGPAAGGWPRPARPPGAARRARARSRPGRRSTPTWAKFLAAARTMVGPPTSISSIDGSERNGYRLQTTRSMGSTPWVSRSARCSGLDRSARMPPWIFGWRVLTRPPSISGRGGHRLHAAERRCRRLRGPATCPPSRSGRSRARPGPRRSRPGRSCRTRTAAPSRQLSFDELANGLGVQAALDRLDALVQAVPGVERAAPPPLPGPGSGRCRPRRWPRARCIRSP